MFGALADGTSKKSGDEVSAKERSFAEASKQQKKRKHLRWGSMTYVSRVTLAFAFIAVMTALVAIGVVSFVWEQHFRTYTVENMRTLAEATAEDIADNYVDTGNPRQDLARAAKSPVDAAIRVSGGIGIQVVASEGADWVVALDSSWINSEVSLVGGAVGSGDASEKSLAPSDPSRYATSAIKVDGQAIGSVRIWVFGSETLLRQADEEFRDNSYQAMLFAAVAAIVLASCIGFLFARNLVAPINRIAKTAGTIKEGDLSARTKLKGEDEIAQLGEMFDAMAESIEKDRDLERRLTTDVAHELRTPLMAIQSTVEAMVDGVFEPSEERLETVNSEVQRLSRLVDALLKLSRLENRSTPMKEDVVDVGELISSIIATHEAFVADSGLTLEYVAESNVLVKGDADMIRQATANLISNAVRYTPEGGHIKVSVSRGDLMAAIAVADTGIGLSPEEARMVFSRFWRADAGRNRESGGLGVGLAVVKEIVDRHGGWVQAEGEKGKGACFTIRIPLYVEEKPRGGSRSKDKAKGKDQR